MNFFELLGDRGFMNFFEDIEYDDIQKTISNYIRSQMEKGTHIKSLWSVLDLFPKDVDEKDITFWWSPWPPFFSSWDISHLHDRNGELMKDEDVVDALVNSNRTNNPL